ncbi:MAG: M20/M25/M40 family metallo-hydrolase [Actinobacteria bacterium]|nr:M20/M25/M40 family metallo-hydrolase [Actinomycetota bacterium]
MSAGAVAASQAEALLGSLVRRRSVNPPDTEEGVVKELEAFFAAHAIPTWREPVAPGRPNLYARVGGDGPTLLLNGHTDTVPAGDGWQHDPFAGDCLDGRLYGRGAVDMKGGLTACALALAALAPQADALPGAVLFAAFVDEEVGASGARHAVEHGLRADAAIVAEPTRMRVVASSNGQMTFHVRLHGVAGHSSAPAASHDSIADALDLALLLRGTGAPYLVGKIAGGIAPNVVADACELEIDRRVRPHETLAGVRDELDGLVARIAAGAPRVPEVAVPLSVPSAALAHDHPAVTVLAGVCGDHEPPLHADATTDAGWLHAAGIPSVICGPGDPDLAHRVDEHIAVRDVADAADAYRRAATPLLLALSAARH